MVDVNLFFQLLHLKPLGACAPPLIVGLCAYFIMIADRSVAIWEHGYFFPILKVMAN